MDEHILKMRGITDLLIDAGHTLIDDDLALQILGGFGLEYDVVEVNLTNRPETLNLQELHFALQAHEIRLQSHNSIPFPSANIVHHRGESYSMVGRGSPSFRGRGGRFSGHDTELFVSFGQDRACSCEML